MLNVVDARGRSCPEPVIMTKKAIDNNPGGEFKILVDLDVAKENIIRFVKSKGYKVDVKEKDKEYTIHIKK